MSKQPIPIIASSPTCGACKLLKHDLEDRGIHYIEKSLIDDPQYFAQHKIKSIPTLDNQLGDFISGHKEIMEYFND